jgi:hypothetical protein
MPLVGDEYDQYPSKAELAHPQSGAFIIELLSHYHVRSYRDAAKELTGATDSHLSKYKDALKKAVNLFGLDADDLFEAGSAPDGDRLEIILEETPSDHVISSQTPTLIGHLYALGLGVEEIVDVLEGYTGEGVHEEKIRNCLKRCALIEGKPSDDAPTGSVPLEEEDLRLGGTTVSTVETDDVKQRAKDIDGVTVR